MAAELEAILRLAPTESTGRVQTWTKRWTIRARRPIGAEAAKGPRRFSTSPGTFRDVPTERALRAASFAATEGV